MPSWSVAFCCLALSLLLWGLPSVSLAQSSGARRLQGQILDKAMGSPVPLANLVLDCKAGTEVSAHAQGVVADLQGNFQWDIASECSLRISAVGYKTLILAPAQWQPAARSKAPTKWYLDPESQDLDAVVVSAGRFEQRLSEVSVSMQILKPGLLQENNLNRLDDAMDRVPGVSLINGQANIRGTSGFSYGAGSRVQVLLDEMPLLSADANDVRWAFMPMEILSQIEVIKGASSVLFGSGALGGAIHMRSQWPDMRPSGMLQSYVLGFDHPPHPYADPYPGRMPLQSGLSGYYQQRSGPVDWTVGTMALTDPGYRVGEFGNRIRTNAAVRYRLHPNLLMSLSANVMSEKIGNFLFWNNLDSAHFPGPGTNDTLLSRRVMLDPVLKYSDRWGNSHQVKNRWYLTQNMGDSDRNVQGLMRYHEYQFQRRWTGPLQTQWTSNSGLVWLQNQVESQGLYGRRRGTSRSLYSQLDVQAGKWGLSLGARAEQTILEGDTMFFPVLRSGLNYAVASGTNLRVSFGQGFRAPSVAERYVRAVAGAAEVLPNPALQPEQGWSGEIGIRQAFRTKSLRGGLDIAAFYTRYQDMIEFSFKAWPDGFGFKAINLANTDAIMWGFEAATEGVGTWGLHRLRWMMGYTFTQPQQRSRPIPNEPEYIVQDTLKYRSRHLWRSDILWERGPWQAGINLRFQSFMLKVDDVFYDIIPGTREFRAASANGDWIADFRIGRQIHRHFKLSALLRNATNRVYLIVPGNVGPPRAYMLQAQWNL